MSVAVVVVAAGSGERLAAGLPKALVALNGRTILDWSVSAFADHPDVDEIVVVAPAASVHAVAERHRVAVVPGGATRTESVRRGLAAVSDGAEYVLVHDAARPLLPAQVITDVVAALRAGAEAVVPVLPVVDTIKQVDDAGFVHATVDRQPLRRIQTPQGFSAHVLRAAYQAAPELVATDDAGVVEAHGGKVATVPGDEAAFKITTPHDLRLAELMAATR